MAKKRQDEVEPLEGEPALSSSEDTGDEFARAFLYRKLYPDAAGALTFAPPPVEDIFGDALIALDANVLLFPYSTSGKSLESIKEAYERLAKDNRLVIPAHAAREFAKNRPDMITALAASIRSRRLPAPELKSFPPLSAEPEFEELLRIEKELNDKYEELREKYQKARGLVESKVSTWHRQDPVVTMYRTVLAKTVHDTSKKDEDLLADAKWRKRFGVPPGYKDIVKDNGAAKHNFAGDLIIWHTLLEVGAKRNMDMVFVTEEHKTDWWHNLAGANSSARHELVDEYRRISGGKTFSIVSFSRFLELINSPTEVVEEIKRKENANKAALKPNIKVAFRRAIIERKAIARLGTIRGIEFTRRPPLELGEEEFSFSAYAFTEAIITVVSVIAPHLLRDGSYDRKLLRFANECIRLASKIDTGRVLPITVVISDDETIEAANYCLRSAMATALGPEILSPTTYHFSSSELESGDQQLFT
jgi:hypothetical protein